MTTITRQVLTDLHACADGLAWYDAHPITDLRSLVDTLVADNHAEWAIWLLPRIATRPQCIRMACYAARLALPAWEAAYPQDDRPRRAVWAAGAVAANDTDDTRSAAYAARSAADAADAAQRAAYAARSATYTTIISAWMRILEDA